MKFCSKCDNMYYISIDEENGNNLIYYCRHCGNKDSCITNESLVVSETIVSNSSKSFSQFINKYTKLDPTLPRTNTIVCPNSQCVTNTNNHEREIIYIRYDNVNIKYVYLCPNCDTVWENSDNF